MAKIHGFGGALRVGGVSGQIVGQLQSWNLDEQAQVTAGYAMGQTWEDNETTVKRWSGSAEVYFDPTDAGQALLDAGASVDLDFYPGGNSTGQPNRSGAAKVTGIPLSANKDGWVSMTINFVGDGPLTKGTVA